MKRLKLVGLIGGGGLLLLVLLLSLARTPTFQTWAVRKATAGQPGVKMDVARVDAGFSAANVTDLRYEQDGMIVTAKGVSAKYSAWDFLTGRKLNVDDVSVQELVFDLTNPTQPTPAASQPKPGAKPTAAAPFDGFLKQLQLALDFRVGTLAAKGRALLPGEQTVAFDLKGARIEAGQSGKLEWTADFSDSKLGAVLRSLRTSGTLSVRLGADRRIDLLEIEGSAAPLGPKISAENFKLFLKAEQPTAAGNETYAASLGLVRNGRVEPLLQSTARWDAVAKDIAGAWEVGIRPEQLAALFAGLGLPEISANGAGAFKVNPATTAASASGKLNVRASQLEKLSPEAGAIGSVNLFTGFDGALSDGIIRLDQLDLDISAADGRKFAQWGLLQKVSFRLKDRSLILANPTADAARIALHALPLAWAQPVMKPLIVESGELSLVLAIASEPDGSRVRVKTIEPLTLRGVTIRDAAKKALIENTTVSLSPALEYSAARITGQLAGLTISTPAGDSATGAVSVEVTNLPTKPVVAFASQLNARIVAAHKAFVPVDTGPLDVAIAHEGRYEGGTLRLNKSTATVTRTGGVILAAHELLQPVEFEVATGKFTLANPAAAAMRFRAGEVPVAWAEPLIAKSKLSGTFSGGTFELSLRSIDDLTLASTAPVSVRGLTAALDGSPMLQSLDVSANLTATKRGDKVTYTMRRLEVRQGNATLGSVGLTGEATLGATFSTTVKGDFEAEVPALIHQPALASLATLARGRVTATFEAAVSDTTTATFALVARELMAKKNNQSLGRIEMTVNALLKADGSGNFDAPLKLTNGPRVSDLAITGTFSKPAAGGTTIFDAKIASTHLVAEDFEAFAALAPESPAAPAAPAPAPTNRRATTVVRAPPAPAPVPTRTPAPRDTEPFWQGANGKVEIDLRRVLYGKIVEITAIRGTTAVTDRKLSLDSLEGKIKDAPFKLVGGMTFSREQPKPYSLTGSVDITDFDIGALLRAANPADDPSVETKVTVGGKFDGTGLNVGDLAQGVYGKFDVAGSKGVLRALSRKSAAGRVVGGVSTAANAASNAASSALSLFRKSPTPEPAAPNVGLVDALSELPFDRFILRAERGEDLNIQFTAIEFLSPIVRVTGTGGITRSANAPDAALPDQPMTVQLQLGSKGGLATLFKAARVLGTATDDQGFTLLRQPFTIGGTAAKPDASALWRMLATSAVTEAGGKIEGLFKK